MRREIALTVCVIALLAGLAHGAALTGTVYDHSLQPVEGAIVELSNGNSTQVYVAKNGTYIFEASPGTYNLTARLPATRQHDSQQVTIPETGSIHFDLILFEDVEGAFNHTELDELAGGITGSIPAGDNGEKATPGFEWGWIIAGLAVLALVVWQLTEMRKKQAAVQNELQAPSPSKQPEIDEFKQKIISLLQANGGAMEQKQLRKELPWSEARVSIELTELEKMWKVKKIKTGRANLVKLI